MMQLKRAELILMTEWIKEKNTQAKARTIEDADAKNVKT
jgi:hypothetical protein